MRTRKAFTLVELLVVVAVRVADHADERSAAVLACHMYRIRQTAKEDAP